MGKSRLAAEALEHIAARGTAAAAPLVLQCSPYHSNEPLYPLVRHLVRLADIAVADSPAVKFAKLARLLGNDAARRESILLIAELLGPDDNYQAVGLEPVAKRHRAIDALIGWFAERANDAVAILVFEDVQWIDPTSKLLLGRLANWAKNTSALIIVTLRADSLSEAYESLGEADLMEPDGRTPGHVTVREIRELDASECRKLAATVETRGRVLESTQLDAVVARSEGIPLYLEELAKAAVGGVDAGSRPETPEQRDAVPHTLSDALMAQLDRLGFAKEVAQHASVIGPEFNPELLASIMSRSLPDLSPMLTRLVDSPIVVRSGMTFDGYRFRHALIREIAYRSLLRKNRRTIHLGVARELGNHPQETGAPSDDLVAQHYSLGGAPLEAIEHWRRGAGKAIARSANEEAIAMLQSALAALEEVRNTASPDLELDLVLTHAMALRSVRGYSAVEVEQQLARAYALCTASGDLGKRFACGVSFSAPSSRAMSMARGRSPPTCSTLPAANPARPWPTRTWPTAWWRSSPATSRRR